MRKKNNICPIIKLFAVKSVCRVFVFNIFTCVFKLKTTSYLCRFGNDFFREMQWLFKTLKFEIQDQIVSSQLEQDRLRYSLESEKKTVNASPEQNYCSVVLRLKSGKLIKLKAAQLTFYRNQGKTIPLKLSAVRPKNSSYSYLLGTGTLVFRFAFQFYTVVGMYSHDVVQTSVCLHHL